MLKDVTPPTPLMYLEPTDMAPTPFSPRCDSDKTDRRGPCQRRPKKAAQVWVLALGVAATTICSSQPHVAESGCVEGMRTGGCVVLGSIGHNNGPCRQSWRNTRSDTYPRHSAACGKVAWIISVRTR